MDRKNTKLSRYDKSQISLVKKLIDKSDVIAYDLDQIIIRSEIPVVKEFNKDFKTKYRWQDHGWNSMADWIKEIGIRDDEKIVDIFNKYWMNPEILIKAPIVSSTYEFIEKMHDIGKKQLIITSRKPYFYESTLNWLEKNNLLKFIPEENIFMNRNEKMRGIDFKKTTIEKYADLMIEDSLIQLKEIVRHLETISDKANIIWIPAGPDKKLRKPRSKKIVKLRRIKYLSLVAQSC